MRHPESESGRPVDPDATLPIDFGDEKASLTREVHVDEAVVVSDEAGDERRLADVSPQGYAGIEADFAEARPIFERDYDEKYGAEGGRGEAARGFAQVEPNYRAGFTAGRDLRYADQTFEAIEAELRREYESSTAAPPGDDPQERARSWERMRAEIQRGFQEARRRNRANERAV